MSEPAPDTDESQETKLDVEYEEFISREAAIEHLEMFIEAFRKDEHVTVTFGEATASFEPPEHLEFAFEYEEDGNEREIELEFEWQVPAGE